MNRKYTLVLSAIALAVAAVIVLTVPATARRSRVYNNEAAHVGYVCRDGAVISSSHFANEVWSFAASGEGWNRETEQWLEYGSIDGRSQYTHEHGIDFDNDRIDDQGGIDFYSVELLPWNTLVPTSTHVFGISGTDVFTLTKAVVNALDDMTPVDVPEVLRVQFQDAGYALTVDAKMVELFETNDNSGFDEGYRDVEIADGDRRYSVYFDLDYDNGVTVVDVPDTARVDAYFDHVIINDFAIDVRDCRLRTIEVDITVGTDPNRCATTNVVDVTAGDEVYYCVEVRNPQKSIVSQTEHLIDIPALGLSITQAYPLPPGASVFFTNADFPELGPVTISEGAQAVASVRSFNRTLNFGVDVTQPADTNAPANDPFTTNVATDSATVSILEMHDLTLYTIGQGQVTTSPDEATYTSDETIILTATPAPGWRFAGWSGDYAGTTNPAVVTMGTTDMSIIATFAPLESESDEHKVFLPITLK